MNKKYLKSEIRRVFGNQRKAAKSLGISESQLSQSLNSQSDQFLEMLRQKGVTILEDNSTHDIENSKMVVAQSGKSRGNATENNHFACAYNSDSLKNVVGGYEKSIALLEQWNGELKDEIKNLREEIERLKRKK